MPAMATTKPAKKLPRSFSELFVNALLNSAVKKGAAERITPTLEAME